MLFDSITIFVPNPNPMIMVLRIYEAACCRKYHRVFPSKLIMANTSSVLTMAFAIVFLASLSLSSGLAKHNSDILNAFEEHLDHELQPFVREKRQKEAEVFHPRNNSPLKLEEELSEPKAVYEKRAVYAEEAKEIGQNGEGKKQGEQPRSVEPKMSNAIEEEEQNVQVIIELFAIYLLSRIEETKTNRNESKSLLPCFQDDVFSYKNMRDLIQILILADEEDIAERLQQLREVRERNEEKFIIAIKIGKYLIP